ncbi:MAG: DUF2249 domain-containing protein [Candidatus Competibacteraceae bacterium]|nr:DUF2249 domain-containing protein [Candidatus Competibacteraceae bacterium]
MTLAEIVVDGRGLEHPEPLERVLAALDELQPGQQLRFLIHRQPYPLYDILHRHHYRYEVINGANGDFEILISPP